MFTFDELNIRLNLFIYIVTFVFYLLIYYRSITDANVYVSIIIEKTVNEIDMRKHITGRQNKMPLMFYINKIICVLRTKKYKIFFPIENYKIIFGTGISWKDLDLFKQPNEPMHKIYKILCIA